jgi:hypothetical protein
LTATFTSTLTLCASVSVSVAAAVLHAGPARADAPVPRLARQGTATQLLVDGKPFLVLGGELGNSSASDAEYMKPLWPKLAALRLNTLLIPVYWELIEPQEGRFDFKLVDQMIGEARRHGMRVVLLWFGSWKNSMSCYAPAWVKTDQRRFPRAELRGKLGLEALSAFSDANRDADARAFAALMQHLRGVDQRHRTVVMVQVENEVAMVEDAADRSAAAQAAFEAPVPKPLMDHLQAHRDVLAPELREAWRRSGEKTAGTWRAVFGPGAAAEEIFMAWHFARYTDHVAQAGKAAYALPMFVNAALNRPRQAPGQYPSAGPLPHVADVWRAGAPHVDFLAPDVYLPNFADWAQRYTRAGNPLFIPEAANDADRAVEAFYALGQHDAIGYSPFAIESIDKPAESPLAKTYDILGRLAPLIAQSQGRGAMAAVLLDKEAKRTEARLGGYRLSFAHDYTFEWSSAARDGTAGSSPSWPRAGGIAITVGPGEYVIAGTGFIVTFAPDTPGDGQAGILAIDEGTYERGRFVPRRRLNGDDTHQGRLLRIPQGSFQIQRLKLYRYH